MHVQPKVRPFQNNETADTATNIAFVHEMRELPPIPSLAGGAAVVAAGCTPGGTATVGVCVIGGAPVVTWPSPVGDEVTLATEVSPLAVTEGLIEGDRTVKDETAELVMLVEREPKGVYVEDIDAVAVNEVLTVGFV